MRRTCRAAAVALALPLLVCGGGGEPAPRDEPSATAPSATSSGGVEFVEFSYASTFTTQGVYTLGRARPGDLMLLYLTDLTDFTMPSGWTPIGDAIVLFSDGYELYPCKGFYRIRQEGDPTTYTIAETTGFLSVYRNVDPRSPIAGFVHSRFESQTPPLGDLRAPADGAASVYFFIGLYHSDILAPDGYEEVYGCRNYDGSSHDSGTGHRLGLAAGQVAGGNIFISNPDCSSPGDPPWTEAVLHVLLAPER